MNRKYFGRQNMFVFRGDTCFIGLIGRGIALPIGSDWNWNCGRGIFPPIGSYWNWYCGQGIELICRIWWGGRRPWSIILEPWLDGMANSATCLGPWRSHNTFRSWKKSRFRLKMTCGLRTLWIGNEQRSICDDKDDILKKAQHNVWANK